MKVKIFPSTAVGSVFAPPSKSYAHRALICGALSKESVIDGIDLSDDISATLDCLKQLGAGVEFLNDKCIKIGGLDPFNIFADEIFCNESGSTLRFLIPICLLSQRTINIIGSKRLMQRPLSVFEDICNNQGLFFELNDTRLSVKGMLNAGEFNIDGSISSQFISGLLFALPLLKTDSVIVLSSNSESMSYINVTIDVLRRFGIIIDNSDPFCLKIKGGQQYNNLSMTVEGDYSNAAFLEAFNIFGGNVDVLGLNKNSIQGDKVYLNLYNELESGTPKISLKDCPDLGPVLFTIAAMKNGAVFVDTDRLRIKESDRVESMKTELEKFGANVVINGSVVKILPASESKTNIEFNGHNDHRIVMSACLLCSVYGGIINGAQAVNKSFPGFFDTVKKLGVEVEYL